MGGGVDCLRVRALIIEMRHDDVRKQCIHILSSKNGNRQQTWCSPTRRTNASIFRCTHPFMNPHALLSPHRRSVSEHHSIS